jgi:hypothetical protein
MGIQRPNISGNAGSATRLQTARNIGGVSFDGTGNINLAGVNAPGNQNTTGNAQTATNAAQLGGVVAANFARSENSGNQDIDTMVVSGVYRLQENVNLPNWGYYGHMLVMKGNSDTITQIVSGFSTGDTYVRGGNPPNIGGTGGWTPWRKLIHDANFQSFALTTAQVTTATAQAQAGEVGTYALMSTYLEVNQYLAPGATRGGAFLNFDDAQANGVGLNPVGQGTWRLMGAMRGVISPGGSYVGLWLRIS